MPGDRHPTAANNKLPKIKRLQNKHQNTRHALKQESRVVRRFTRHHHCYAYFDKKKQIVGCEVQGVTTISYPWCCVAPSIFFQQHSEQLYTARDTVNYSGIVMLDESLTMWRYRHDGQDVIRCIE